MLRVYVASDCPASEIAMHLAECLRVQYPKLPLEIVHVDEPGIAVPDEIFGTPIYTWDDQVLFLGNPSQETLLERVRGFYDHRS